jgi:phospholipid transport system substrate-binding protein
MSVPLMTRRRFALVVLLAPALVSAQAEAPNAIASTPAEVVETLHATLLATMRDADTLGFSGRYQQLLPVLQASFDFPAIARIATGRHWKDLDEAGRSAFIQTFTELSVATYATNFAGFNGESFSTLGADTAAGRTVVRTELVQADGDKVSLNYLLHERDGAWRIVNVIAQGVSDLALKRAEYTAVIKAEGIDSLIKRLAEKVAAMGHQT